MTLAPASAPLRQGQIRRGGLTAAARLLYLELRHSAMAWMLPVAIGLFWITTYRKAMAMPPLWNLRATTMHAKHIIFMGYSLPADDVAAELLDWLTLPVCAPGLRMFTETAVLLGFVWVDVADEDADCWLFAC